MYVKLTMYRTIENRGLQGYGSACLHVLQPSSDLFRLVQELAYLLLVCLLVAVVCSSSLQKQ
jgi:hypothetical protein